MKTCAALLFAMLIAAPSSAAEMQMFRERNFRGSKMVLSESSSRINFSPRAVRVEKGDAWLVCPRPFFGGQCKIIGSDTADLSLPRGFSGTVQSARPVALDAASADPSKSAPARPLPSGPDAPPKAKTDPDKPKL